VLVSTPLNERSAGSLSGVEVSIVTSSLSGVEVSVSITYHCTGVTSTTKVVTLKGARLALSVLSAS
jgi:hypothetical protein